jgi:hypothetical protein
LVSLRCPGVDAGATHIEIIIETKFIAKEFVLKMQ